MSAGVPRPGMSNPARCFGEYALLEDSRYGSQQQNSAAAIFSPPVRLRNPASADLTRMRCIAMERHAAQGILIECEDP